MDGQLREILSERGEGMKDRVRVWQRYDALAVGLGGWAGEFPQSSLVLHLGARVKCPRTYELFRPRAP